MFRVPLLLLGLALAACQPYQIISAPGHYPQYKDIGDVPGYGSAIVLGDDVTITCAIAGAPAFSVMRCVGNGGGFPYTVPAGKTLCLVTMALQNKYPWDPPVYGGSMKQLYLQEAGFTVTSYAPRMHFDPPFPFFAGQKLLATISNSQTEAQNVYAFEQGFLVDAGKPCRRN